jgi:hypothetical protein
VGSKLERERRASQVYKWLVDGMPLGEIRENIKREWGVRRSATIQDYINDAGRMLEKNLEADRKTWLHISMTHYQDLYKQLVAKGELGEAAKIQEKLDRLIGIM